MCKFCDKIYPDEDVRDVVFCEGKYPDGGPSAFISFNKETGAYDINVDPGDPYELGVVDNINFCPYCGRKVVKYGHGHCQDCSYFKGDGLFCQTLKKVRYCNDKVCESFRENESKKWNRLGEEFSKGLEEGLKGDEDESINS